MKQLAIVLFAALAFPSGVHAQSASPQRLAWLQGCWASVGQERVIEEQWMAPRGKSMFGTSRTVHDGQLVGYEYMMVREQGDRLAFEVRPSGKAPVVFIADQVDDGVVVFANAHNEFPQHIGYRRDGANAVLAWIEGTTNGEARRVDFHYRQVACAGG
jgi:hypothetical protein